MLKTHNCGELRIGDAGTAVIQSQVIDAHAGFGSAAAAPLVTEGKLIGALVLADAHPEALKEIHAELLVTIAHQIALAFETDRGG